MERHPDHGCPGRHSPRCKSLLHDSRPIQVPNKTRQIYQAPYAGTRNFPITFDASGDIVYPQFAYPMRGWIISAPLSGVLSALVPVVVIALAQLRIRSFWDFNNAVLGLLYSIVLATLFQVIIKMLIGGFRPYWLTICQPDISLAQSHNATGLNGVGFHQIMYTAEVCTNPNKKALKSAMTSFPSGHSTTAFAGLVFLFLWMNAKLKVWANFQASFYWLALLLAPLLGAVLMAACLTVDQAHNWYDIVAGSAIGTMTSFMVYRVCYAAVWDWRYNHIPLRKNRVFDYAAAAALTPQKGLLIRKWGWGKKRRMGFGKRAGRGKARVGSTASSAAYTGNGPNGTTSMEVPHGQGPPYGEGMHPNQGLMQGQGMAPQGQDVRSLDPAPVEPNGPNPSYGRGDHMV
jgi:membrane-associated phospholipid phosphatase